MIGFTLPAKCGADGADAMGEDRRRQLHARLEYFKYSLCFGPKPAAEDSGSGASAVAIEQAQLFIRRVPHGPQLQQSHHEPFLSRSYRNMHIDSHIKSQVNTAADTATAGGIKNSFFGVSSRSMQLKADNEQDKRGTATKAKAVLPIVKIPTPYGEIGVKIKVGPIGAGKAELPGKFAHPEMEV